MAGMSMSLLAWERNQSSQTMFVTIPIRDFTMEFKPLRISIDFNLVRSRLSGGSLR